jgi:CBS domain containing-hemolysin-like protein
MTELILAVLIVIVVSAMCSLFEAVLYSVPISHIESLAHANKRAGTILQKLRENVDEPIAAILSLNTISNTAGAAVAGAIATDVLGSTWLGIFSATFTLAILFFSEVVPKTVGVVYARPLSEWIAQPLRIMVVVFKPLIKLLGLATKAIAGQAPVEYVSEAELLVMTQLGMKSGVINEDEGAVIKNILSLEDKGVREVMTPRTVMFALPADITTNEAGKYEMISAHSRIPVYFNDIDNVIGIVFQQDVFTELAEDRPDTKLSALMKPVDFVFERMDLNQVLNKFLEARRHMFVVLGEHGGTSGVITLEDVIEEILGKEIVDEFDTVEDMQQLAEERRRKLLQNRSSATYLATSRNKPRSAP